MPDCSAFPGFHIPEGLARGNWTVVPQAGPSRKSSKTQSLGALAAVGFGHSSHTNIKCTMTLQANGILPSEKLYFPLEKLMKTSHGENPSQREDGGSLFFSRSPSSRLVPCGCHTQGEVGMSPFGVLPDSGRKVGLRVVKAGEPGDKLVVLRDMGNVGTATKYSKQV